MTSQDGVQHASVPGPGEIPATDNEILNRVYRLGGPEEAAEVYDAWAASYDTDTVDGMGYVAPRVAATRLADELAPGRVVLDVGCGTGLVGQELSGLVDVTIDGVDLSTGMLEQAARRGIYRHLKPADLTRPMEVDTDSYDAVVCVGTLTQGHLGPEPLDEMVRVTRPGGVVVATVLDTVWESGGFRDHVQDLTRRRLVTGHEVEQAPYHEREEIGCRLLVLEVA